MRRITIQELSSQERLVHDVYGRTGALLVPAGTEPSPAVLDSLRRQSEAGLYIEGGEGSGARAKVSSGSGTIWQGLRQRATGLRRKPKSWSGGLHSGEVETRRILPAPDPAEEARRALARRIRNADGYAAERARKWEKLSLRVESSPRAVRARPGGLSEWPSLEELARIRTQRVARVRTAIAAMMSGQMMAVDDLFLLVEELIDLAADHPQQYAQIALLPPLVGDYLDEHCYRTSALCVALAIRLGWSRGDAQLAGLSGLLADAGMSLVPREIRSAGRPLNEYEINRVFRHPMFSVTMMDTLIGLPEPVRMAAYQHHERDNGTGYPSGVRGSRISDLAKVVAAADAYAAGVGARAYRIEQRPYDAIYDLIRSAAEGVFSRKVVRALVGVTGLFPVGSYVLLSSGAPARVIAVNEDRIDRPQVELVDRGGEPTGECLDLTEASCVEGVSRPIDRPRRHRSMVLTAERAAA